MNNSLEVPVPAVGSLEAQRGAMLAWVEAVAPYGIFTTDAELKIRTWNQWLAVHSGMPAAQVVGRTLHEVFPDVRLRKLDGHFHRALEGEIGVLSTALHKYLLPLRSNMRSDTQDLMLQTVRIAPLVFADQIVGTIATIEDVTQRESQALTLRKQQEHDRLLSSTLALLLASDNPLQAATELLPRIATPLRLEVYFNYLLAPDGSELRLHAAGGVTPEVRKTMAVQRLGEGPCGTAALRRQPLLVPHVQDSLEEHAQVIRRLGLRTYAGFPLLLGDRLLGTLSFGSYQRDVIPPEEIEFLSTVAQYLAIAIERALRENALRQAQQSLSEHAVELETKITERTAKLHETIAQLESFSYTIAHDLRAPIRSLKGYSEILFADHARGLSEDGQAIIRRLQRASNRLDALTRDLLAFSKIAREDVQLAPVDVDELVRELLIVTPAWKKIIMTRAPLGTVLAQRTLLEQCLVNLFDNAVKFGRPGVPLQIIVRAGTHQAAATAGSPASPAAFSPSTVRREGDSDSPVGPAPAPTDAAVSLRRIWIEDNGIGIAPYAHKKIFGIFERVSGLDNVEGTGIGLAIVARAMQQMGGKCGVESELGAGSRFWLELASAD